jgi:hypothetical protein
MTADLIQPTTRYRAIVGAFALAYVAWTLVLLFKAEALAPEPPSLAGMSVQAARRAVNEYSRQGDRRVVFATLPNLLANLTCAALSGRTGLRSLRSGQFPPAGANVLWCQRIVHGIARKVAGRLSIASCWVFRILRRARREPDLEPAAFPHACGLTRRCS